MLVKMNFVVLLKFLFNKRTFRSFLFFSTALAVALLHANNQQNFQKKVTNLFKADFDFVPSGN